MPTLKEMLNALLVMNNPNEQNKERTENIGQNITAQTQHAATGTTPQVVEMNPFTPGLTQQKMFEGAQNIMDYVQQFQKQYPSYVPIPVQQNTLAQQTQMLQNALAEATATGQYKGQPTFERLVTEAGLLGSYKGQPTLENIFGTAGLTGYYQGKPTFEREMAEKEYALNAAQLSGGLGGGGGIPGEGELALDEDTYNALTRRELFNNAKAAIDQFWAEQGTPTRSDAVAAIRNQLNIAKEDLANSFVDSTEANRILEALRQYLLDATGITDAELERGKGFNEQELNAYYTNKYKLNITNPAEQNALE